MIPSWTSPFTIINSASCDLINNNWPASQCFLNFEHRLGIVRQHLEWNMNLNTVEKQSHRSRAHPPVYQNLTDQIMAAFELQCPMTYIVHTQLPWLTPEIEAEQRSIKHKLMLARLNNTLIRKHAGRILETAANPTINF